MKDGEIIIISNIINGFNIVDFCCDDGCKGYLDNI